MNLYVSVKTQTLIKDYLTYVNYISAAVFIPFKNDYLNCS